MNILQISEALKGVPKDFLVREATMPSGNYPQYLVVSELSRRTAMEKQFAGIAAQQNQPQETVADKTVREATPMPMAAMQGLKSPQTTYQEEPSGQETMGIPGAVRMFEGGRVAFDKGGLGEDRLKEEEDYKLPFYKRLGKFIPFSRLLSEKDEYGLAPDDYTDTEVLEARIAELGDPDPSSPSFLMKQNLLSKLSEQKEYLGSQPKGGIAVDFPYFGQADSLTRNIKAMDKQIANMEEGPEKQALIDKRNVAEKKRTSFYTEGKAPSITDEVAKDQVNRKEQLQKEADQSAKKEKDALSEFERLSKQKYEMPELKSTLNTEEAFKLLGPAPTEKTFENVMKDLSNARQKDFLKVVEENTNKMQDGIDKEKRQAIPMSLISAGLAIASAPSGSGLLGAITEGAKAGFSKFEGLQKDIKSSEKTFRDAQNALAMAKDARQEGDMKTAREQVNRYEDKMESYKDKQVNINMEVQKQLASNDQLLILTYV